MTAGRKPLAVPQMTEPEAEMARAGEGFELMRDEQRGAIARNIQAEQHVRAVALQVGYQLPGEGIDPDLIQRDISANMRRSVEACLEVGRGLAVLKAACEHGQFMARLDVLGIEDRVARRFMQAATKFSNRATSPVLLKAAGTQSKLFELMMLDDEQVDELALTGQTGELKLDDVATMSVKELRLTVREERAEKKALEELLAEKNQQIDAERAKARRIATLPPDERHSELMKEAGGLVAEALGILQGKVRQAFLALASASPNDMAAPDSRQIMAGHVAEIQQRLNELREEFVLDDHVGDGTPRWASAFPVGADTAER